MLFGTLVAETILASVHVRARKQAGHMDASDLIKALQNTLRGGGRPHMACVRPLMRLTCRGPGWEFADQVQFRHHALEALVAKLVFLIPSQ